MGTSNPQHVPDNVSVVFFKKTVVKFISISKYIPIGDFLRHSLRD